MKTNSNRDPHVSNEPMNLSPDRDSQAQEKGDPGGHDPQKPQGQEKGDPGGHDPQGQEKGDPGGHDPQG